MTQEDKELLLIDLCARLPYGVYVYADGMGNYKLSSIELYKGNIIIKINEEELFYHLYEIKPYLRPISSMTEEEKMEVKKLGVCYDGAFHNDIYDIGISMEEAFTAMSWFLERHFDINYLIEKGLALKAPENMYKIK